MNGSAKKKAAIDLSLNTLVGIMLTAFMLLVAGNIFADVLLNVEVTDQEELSDFKSRLDSMQEGRTYAFSFHTVPEGAEFVAFMNSSELLNVSFAEVNEEDIDSEITDRSDWMALVPVVGGGLARIVYNRFADSGETSALENSNYIAEPSGCEEGSSCMCIFRGLDDTRIDEGKLHPIKTSCTSIDIEFTGDPITLLSNDEIPELNDHESVAEVRNYYEEDPPILYRDGSERKEDIKLLSNVDEDSEILTIYLQRGEDFFVACTQRYHCQRQYDQQVERRTGHEDDQFRELPRE